ncbi:MAG: PilT/PilU family type 4a pilus ATPase [Kiritimatiellia bacterium]|jgi:twitching motility protein PilT
MAKIDRYLEALVSGHGSDLHMSATRPPYVRIHGVLCPIEGEPAYSSDEILAILKEIVPEANYKQLVQDWDTDCAYEIPGVARFRVNGFRDINGFGCALRVIPERIPSFEELALPSVMRDFCNLSKGLVVITGPTGSGKSTTLAAMIDHINRSRAEHIITIEDPVEFVHKPVRCVINQREVHRDTRSFAIALRAALREDPDVVLVGEMRDLETMEIAIETAETGHLVFATLHTNTAATTVDRIIDKFPAARQNQIRSMLADTLRGVVAQTLCRREDTTGRIAVFEVLVVTTAAAALIREGKTHMLPSIIQTSRSLGMQTFADELVRLVSKGIVSPEEAYRKAVDKAEIETKFGIAGISLDFKKREEAESYERALKRAGEVLKETRDAHNADPKNPEYQMALAWLLATSPFKELRDGKLALRLSEQASKAFRDKDPDYLAVVAVAYAELGNFRRAIDIAKRAMTLYVENGDAIKAATMKSRTTLFENQKPYRDE